MAIKILIMGLPGAGKTTLAAALNEQLCDHRYTTTWLNADIIRKQYDDWDFSDEGRIRQSVRMHNLAEQAITDYVIADFVAALPIQRDNFKADYTVWVDTIDRSIHEDTNKAFVKPKAVDFHITEKNAVHWAQYIFNHIME